MDPIYNNNLTALEKRFPELAARATGIDPESVAIGNAPDGGYYYAAQEENGWRPLSHPEAPVKLAEDSVNAYHNALSKSMSPAVIVGLAPGFELDMIYSVFDDLAQKVRFFRRIYILVLSAERLIGWMKATDRTKYLEHPDIEFYWHKDIPKIVELMETDYSRSHTILPMSSLPDHVVNTTIQPFSDLYMKRQAEEECWREENEAYYNAITDEELAEVISGKAGRKPRLFIPTHTSSVVTQYSARDTCAAFEKLGWETKRLLSTHACPSWNMVRIIHEFKPDIYLNINHLRGEGTRSEYPKNMTFITWVQDSPPYILNHEAAEKWNKMTEGGSQKSEDGDQRSDEESKNLPTDSADNSDKAGPLSKTSAQLKSSTKGDISMSTKESLCDLSASVANPPPPVPKLARDLIIGYTNQLKPFGYREDRLHECPMIVNTNIFKPRELTDEQKEKYGCDVMFASRCGAPTEEYVDELLKNFTLTRKIDTSRDMLMEIHDHLWKEYRAERTFTSEPQLKEELFTLSLFKSWFASLSQDDQIYVLNRIYWRLNDIIYRQVVVEWLVEYAEEVSRGGLEDKSQKKDTCGLEKTSGFKLHLYGDGWSRNPKFAAYYRGIITHGSSLSIAYQAAKRCLHLNSTEGTHQRLLEIIAASGTPIQRCANKVALPSHLLHNAQRKIFDKHAQNDLTEIEAQFWNDWLFNIVMSELSKQPTADTKELTAAASESAYFQAVSFPDWTQPAWHKQNITSPQDIATSLSSVNTESKSSQCYATLAHTWHSHCLTKKILSMCQSSSAGNTYDSLPNINAIVQLVRALHEYKRDATNLRTIQAILPICGISSRLTCAERLLDSEPELAETLLDDQSWRNFPDFNHRGNWLVLAGRIALKKQLIMNPAKKAKLPDWIESGINECYATTSNLTDLYARIGLGTYCTEYNNAFEFCEKDKIIARLSPAWQINLTQLHIAAGNGESAIPLIEEFLSNPRLEDEHYIKSICQLISCGAKDVAESSLKQRLALQPSLLLENEGSHSLQIANTYLDTGNATNARRLLEETFSAIQPLPTTAPDVAMSLLRARSFDMCKQLMNQPLVRNGLATSPTSPPVYAMLALCNHTVDETTEQFRKVLDNGASSPWLKMWHYYLLGMQGNDKQARIGLHSLLQTKGDHEFATLCLLGNAYLYAGHMTEALDIYTSLLSLYQDPFGTKGDPSWIFMTTALIHRVSGNSHLARQAAVKGIAGRTSPLQPCDAIVECIDVDEGLRPRNSEHIAMCLRKALSYNYPWSQVEVWLIFRAAVTAERLGLENEAINIIQKHLLTHPLVSEKSFAAADALISTPSIFTARTVDTWGHILFPDFDRSSLFYKLVRFECMQGL